MSPPASNAAAVRVAQDDLSRPAVQALVRLHLEGMRAASPPEAVFALDVQGLVAPGVRFFVAWIGDEAVGIGALKHLEPGFGEIKSMRTDPRWLRRGVAARILRRLIDEAAASGVRRLSLETGSGEAFDAALSLYRGFGFEPGDAFADYVKTEFSQFFHLDLALSPSPPPASSGDVTARGL